jgi:hypothetical protein
VSLPFRFVEIVPLQYSDRLGNKLLASAFNVR